MKNVLYLLVLISGLSFSQQKYLTRTGNINFEASVPSFEEVAASHEAVTAILNSENGEFAALALVKGFRFKNALMEEHFNENYAESETYPKATFSGKIISYDKAFLDGDEHAIKIKGILEFHGVKKEVEVTDGTILSNKEGLRINGEFMVLASDFGIDIPKIVAAKLRDDVGVSFVFTLNEQ
ncbi:MAG: YceI family protein [Flavobacteriaceae bacterium]|nr:YceI family protein [Flavobacteriaceae bacterium]